MKFTKINTFPLTEESIVNGQTLCEFEVDVPKDKLTYSLESSYNNYFSINENKILLTSAGKKAVNEDFPEDITKELRSLEFKLIVINNETNEKISQDITIQITRVIDSPPYIKTKFEHLCYEKNLYPINHHFILSLIIIHCAIFME